MYITCDVEGSDFLRSARARSHLLRMCAHAPPLNKVEVVYDQILFLVCMHVALGVIEERLFEDMSNFCSSQHRNSANVFIFCSLYACVYISDVIARAPLSQEVPALVSRHFVILYIY
jgi:hypothetical protein